MAQLFSPLRLAMREFANRVVVSPMCQYSALDGVANDWHFVHYGALANSGAGLLVVEATAVEARGRITPGDLGLYSDACEAGLRRVVENCRRYGTSALGLQIAHAGRKASAHVPWQGGRPLSPEDGAWETLAPSAVPFAPDWHVPRDMSAQDMAEVKAAFVATTERALRLDFDAVELHGAHGYLMHAFLSPLANLRDDDYGGSAENRMRFPLEVAAAMRAVWPKDRVLGARISGSDWLDGGLTVDDAAVFAGRLKDLGYDYVCVSSGGVVPRANIPVGPGYQVPLAAEVKRRTGLPTRAVGLISTPEQAEAIIASGQADCVALERAFLDNPHWGWLAAHALGADVKRPPQYERAAPKLWPGAPTLPLSVQAA